MFEGADVHLSAAEDVIPQHLTCMGVRAKTCDREYTTTGLWFHKSNESLIAFTDIPALHWLIHLGFLWVLLSPRMLV
jgi:hypothetical protein